MVQLTKREAEIVSLLCCGQSNQAIGTALGISARTVKNHLTAVYRKWRVADRSQVIITAFGTGLHDPRQCWVDMGKM